MDPILCQPGSDEGGARCPDTAPLHRDASWTELIATAATDETGIDAEVIDLRWLDRASLDWDTLGAGIRKTSRILIAERVSAPGGPLAALPTGNGRPGDPAQPAVAGGGAASSVQAGAAASPMKPGAAATAGPGYRDIPHARIRRAIATRLAESIREAPVFTIRGSARVEFPGG